MTHFLDISVLAYTPAYSRKAKAFELETKILFKAPAVELTTVRLCGTPEKIREFLRSQNWKEEKIELHKNAFKSLTQEAKETPDWKNRGLLENRADLL